jgi:VanZ family protein
MTLYKKFLYWLPAILWMTVIFSFSSRPSLHASDFQLQDFLIKKSAHFVEYFLLLLITMFSLSRANGLTGKKLIFTSLFICLIYAISDEFHQTFVPGRDGRPRDAMIDFGGSLTAGLLIYFKQN